MPEVLDFWIFKDRNSGINGLDEESWCSDRYPTTMWRNSNKSRNNASQGWFLHRLFTWIGVKGRLLLNRLSYPVQLWQFASHDNLILSGLTRLIQIARTYRLLTQIVLLVVFAGILAGISYEVITAPGEAEEKRQRQIKLRADLEPVFDSIELAPSDLAPGWKYAIGGIGLQGQLRHLNMGAATEAAESVAGNTASWWEFDGPRLLSAGLIVTESPELAEAAYKRLQTATPEENVAYVEPGSTLLEVVPLPGLSGENSQFGFIVRAERVTSAKDAAQGILGDRMEVTVLWALEGQALIFIALNAFFENPPQAHPADLPNWLNELTASYKAATGPLLTAEW